MAAPVFHRVPLRVSDQQVAFSVRGARVVTSATALATTALTMAPGMPTQLRPAGCGASPGRISSPRRSACSPTGESP